MKKILYFLALAFILPIAAYSQYYETGQDPASIRWRQINTTNFQIIFPEDFEPQAQRVAYIFEKVYAYSAENLGQSPRKISVVLHTHTVKSNALVAWAPRRIEFYTTPHQQIYAQDWLEQLAIHEFTHVMQMDRVQEELPSLLTLLLGEQVAAAVVGAYLPFWLIEGDAVSNETAFTEAGRGRLPSFLMENKAAVLEKGDYSLNKSYLGSYKDYVPNHYYLGYWLTGKVKEKYGTNIWNAGMTKAARNPFSVTPINSALKKETGMNQNGLYKQVFSELKNEWQQEIAEAGVQEYPVVSPARKAFTNYLYAHPYKGNLYALCESLGDIPRIVCIDSLKKEKVLHSPAYLFEESFSGEKNLLIWSENQPDIRWTHSDRSVICVLNLETGEKKRFRTENKLFAPKIAPDLTVFAAVEVDVRNQSFLSVFDLKTGERRLKYATPGNPFFFTPCWNENSDRLFFIALNSSGKYLASLKIGEERHEALSEASFANIKNPEYHSGKLYFIGSYSGIDNIYAIDLSDKSKYQLSSVKFGANYPAVSEAGTEIIFSNYSSDGFALAKMDNQPDNWKKLTTFPDKKFELAENLSAQMKGELQLEKPDSVLYPSKKYSKLGHALNFHSWAPLYVDADDYEIRPGVTLFSQNKLGTSVVNLGYDYDRSEKTGKFVAGFKYSGWFPVFEADLKAGKSASEYYQITQTLNQQGQVIKQDTAVKRFSWNEQELSMNMNLPLNLSSGKYNRLLQPEIRYEYTNITHDSSTPDNFFNGNYQTLTYRLYFHNLQRMAHQDLQHDWGQIVELVYRHSPFGSIDFGSLIAAHSYLYFPGLLKNHGFRIYNGYQEKTISDRNSFSNTVRIPRGYHSTQNTRFYSFAGDYRFPIVCPDLSIGKLAYIKRIKASLFYDYGNFQAPVFTDEGDYQYSVGRTMSSLGIELQSDVHVLRFFAPMEVGVRSTYRPDYQDMQFELLFSIDFSGL
ncbi:MAG: hypothetical protein A2W90_19605 [Bacteroidetes bacterium GWF2_42_66]|nr:MAG: hypothetical protein A2W92_17875 [Bacteroidetes bacterium GWA2_42_15]OFX98633.1 MAG: hypothetical protein A2W89_10090 [Bacteroidetes bacterium GWE2_42_39]OFY43170.1 MAG: hypothetical protein A2W90_19605 [Bacteroidetes bacterium GWF2_42_66]HBL76977.1 hypothetical protein [Prolixibacteraceae bacterium]HCR89621.1 hypothetical protein [Prolixibacteraceae bacterium]